MDERKYNRTEHPWDDGVYGTGPTEPPKNRGGLVALLLILVIFLIGIITVLGILNVRLFHQLQSQEEYDLSISFSAEATTESYAETTPIGAESGSYPTAHNDITIALHESPESVENIPDQGGMALQDIYAKNIPSVVSITCTLHSGSSSGTGVILSEDGYIVTNAHVVDGAVVITVQLTDDRVLTADLVGKDEISDLAVLYIDAENLTPAELGNSSSLRVGDTVVAIGDPLGVQLRGTYTDGIISGINRDVSVDGRTMTLIQTNAALNSGNSGGPLINCYGQVIGINTMKIGAFTDSAGVEGLGFAIPSATVKDIVDQIIQQGYVSGRPTLGISGESLPTFYQHYYRLPAGLYITAVDSSSYASYYGIEVGDILLQIDDTRITTMDELNTVLYGHEVGDIVKVIIYRSGQQTSIDLTLTEDKG